MKDRDFSVSISAAGGAGAARARRKLQPPRQLLRDERQSLYQRELLLDTVIQATPLVDGADECERPRRLQQHRRAADISRRTQARRPVRSTSCSQAAPEPLQQAVASEADTLFTIEGEGESEIYHLSQRGFLLNSQAHRLFLLKQLTRELSRQEVETWKKVIRVIAHELNNSLAPISSLAHSGRQFVAAARRSAVRAHLPHDRGSRATSAHVHRRLRALRQAAATAARSVDWNAFLRSLQNTAPFRIVGELPTRPAVFDPAQVEQVIINLVKNATEAGAPPTGSRCTCGAGGRLAHAGAGSRRGHAGGSATQRAAAVLLDEAVGRRPRLDGVSRGHRGARRPDLARESPGRRAGGDLVDSGDHVD